MARKRKLSQSSSDFAPSDSDADHDLYTPAKAAGSSRGASTKIAKRAGAPPKKQANKKARRGKAVADDALNDDEEELVEEGRVLPHAVSTHTITQAKAIREALLSWYDTVHEARGMPWRKPFDHGWSAEQRAQRAYEVWISEIMLQQTQVVTVIPYYNKWMAKFPTIKDLARSDIDTVNGLWKGLGYYSRAARILQGAQKAVKELSGRLPNNAKDMEASIPGIGRYSAGAICSIAYNQCVPVLDGNVHRLLSRFLALHTPPKAKQALDVLWEGAAAMVEGADRPGDTNQALIELGATICKVHDPQCASCPLQPWCTAHARQQAASKVPSDASVPSSEQELPDIEDLCTLCRPLPIPSSVTSYPMKVERKKAREELDVVSVIEWRATLDEYDDRWTLLVRRPEGGLLAGLHEFPTTPNVSVTSPQDMADCAQSSLRQLLVHPPPLSCSPAARNPPRRSVKPGPPSDSEEEEEEGVDDLRIAKTKPAGDVLHIFSHIRKTYRVQWVLLLGGSGRVDHSDQPQASVQAPDAEDQQPSSVSFQHGGRDPGSAEDRLPVTALPPALHPSPRSLTPAEQAVKPKGKAKSKQANGLTATAKRKKLIAADSVREPTRLEAMWVRMDDVPDANPDVDTSLLAVHDVPFPPLLRMRRRPLKKSSQPSLSSGGISLVNIRMHRRFNFIVLVTSSSPGRG
ncbi:hypothetical protein EIP91_011924 [Steccherinum ochraceum]|uniref:Adenine DNA glycosylase n=1 Tax=Steccherinum ochraceum TaxID=92696 RepID=A0A4R0RJW3_9APHY|nr:hypothetical protein EIP91_011924 [Steccherinum ochraceum]